MLEVPLRDRLIACALLPLSPARIRRLLETFDPLSSLSRAPVRLLQSLLSIDATQAQWIADPWRNDELRKRVEALRESAVTLADDAYPPLLARIADPPLALFYRGDLAFAHKPLLAMVGSRRASPYAISVASHIARELALAGIGVVSGLAEGVDAASHRAALDACGDTIAVLGTGIDIIYPRSNRRLFRAIEQRGLVLTEFPAGTPPLPYNFPVRNRIISGLTLGTIIVEATGRSGSLITARTASEQNREVFAVPGSIFAPGSEGTNRLIQVGAKLVHDVADIFDELPQHLRPQPSVTAELQSPLREVLEAFARDAATHVDTAAESLGRPVATLSEALLQLELDGWLRSISGGRYVRVR